ncbi:MAG: hypothetical protein NTV01_22780 [Bacteroidia bacterium]|nr:hypothetical protein [Bacteroidia bacterium]
MKRFSLPLLLSLFSLVIIAGNVEKIYTFSNYKIEQNGSCQSISLSQTMLAGLIGEPMLPYHQVALMLPPGEKATSIQIAGTEK